MTGSRHERAPPSAARTRGSPGAGATPAPVRTPHAAPDTFGAVLASHGRAPVAGSARRRVSRRRSRRPTARRPAVARSTGRSPHRSVAARGRSASPAGDDAAEHRPDRRRDAVHGRDRRSCAAVTAAAQDLRPPRRRQPAGAVALAAGVPPGPASVQARRDLRRRRAGRSRRHHGGPRSPAPEGASPQAPTRPRGHAGRGRHEAGRRVRSAAPAAAAKPDAAIRRRRPRRAHGTAGPGHVCGTGPDARPRRGSLPSRTGRDAPRHRARPRHRAGAVTAPVEPPRSSRAGRAYRCPRGTRWHRRTVDASSAPVLPVAPCSVTPRWSGADDAVDRLGPARPVTTRAGPGAGGGLAVLRGDDGSYAVQLQLHPHDLGAVQVTVDVRHGEISVQLHSPDAAAQDALRDGLSDLRRQLEEQGLRTGSMEVGSGGADPRQRDGTRPQPVEMVVPGTAPSPPDSGPPFHRRRITPRST